MTPEPDITARDLAENVMGRWSRESVTPDPAPYGAELPRSGVTAYVNALWSALDAANAEVLALRRRERVMHRVAMRYRAWSNDDRAEVLALREVVEAVRAWAETQHQARDLIALLPAPTGDDEHEFYRPTGDDG